MSAFCASFCFSYCIPWEVLGPEAFLACLAGCYIFCDLPP